MNVVDSSGWLEYFAGGENADFFAGPIEANREIVRPDRKPLRSVQAGGAAAR